MNRGSVTVQLPKLDYRLDSATVMVIVQQNNSEEENSAQNIISVIDDGLCLHHKLSWIAGIWKVNEIQQCNSLSIVTLSFLDFTCSDNKYNNWK